MTMMSGARLSHTALALLASLAGLLLVAPAQAQDEAQQFNAFAVVQASGTAVTTGDKQALVVATLNGAFFIETDEGPVHSGIVACPGMVKVDLETTRQTGSGACTFKAIDGATSYGEWECAGYNLIGCRGTFRLNGGTGRLAGVSGEATMIWRPSSHELQKQLDGSVQQSSTGIILWRDFKIAKK